jgi:hypothetical protein
MEKLFSLINPLKKIYLQKIVHLKQEYGFSDELFKIAKDFVFILADENISPNRITDYCEEGYCFMFKKNNLLIYFEIYSDGDFGFISVDKQNEYKIIHNQDINNLKEFVDFYSLV